MKKRLCLFLLVLVMLFMSGCDLLNSKEGNDEPIDSLYEVYRLAEANGYEGSYEDWIESIRGENGRAIELVVENNYLCYKYVGDSTATPIYDLGQLAGAPGAQGIQGVDGVSITKVEKTATDGLVDTYTITFSNGTSTTYTVNNGSVGPQGLQGADGVSITKVEKTATDGLVDTYTITFSNGTSTTYTVNNGAQGSQGATGNGILKIEKTSSPDPYTDIYTITFTDGTTFDFTINNGKPLNDTEYDVTFDSDGGSEVEGQKVKFGYKAVKPENPTLDGYEFDGWYVGDEKWNFSTTLVTENVNLKAKWIPSTFSINYNYNDGEEVVDAITAYTILDEDIVLPVPTRLGNTFGGWYDNQELTGDAIDKIAKGSFGDKELYAKWTLNTHKITFRSNGGTEYQDLEFNYNGEVTLPTPERSGYKFLFWSNDENMLKAYDGKYDEDQDLTFYARWLVDGMSTYTVESYLQNADGTYSVKPYEVLTYEAQAETIVTARTKSYDGYTAPNALPTGLVVGDNSLKLKVFYTVRTYTLTVNGKSYNYKFGEAIKPIDNPTKAGYTFTGWSSEIPETMPKQDLTISPTWQANVYKVSFDTNGSDEVIESMNVIYNQSLNLPTPTIDGYEFVGWFYNDTKVSGNWYILEDVTLKAHWATKYDNFVFTLVNDHYEVTSYTGSDSEVTIPAAIDGVPVTSIAAELFKDNSTITKLTLQKGITNVGDHAFMNMSNLEELTIPAGITAFGEYVLQDTDITNITIDMGNTLLLGLYDYDEANMPDDLVLKLKYDSSTYVQPYEGVLKNINNKEYSVDLDETLVTLGSNMFYNCKGLSNIIMHDGLKTIANGAFNECSSLKSITIPDSVTKIGYEAFSNCSSLTNVTIPDGVTSIEYNTFYYCNSLVSIVLPNSVTDIGAWAFCNCTSLKNITIPEGVKNIKEGAFWGLNINNIVLPTSLTTIEGAAFRYSSVSNVYYSGSKAQWMNINIGANNDAFASANIVYNSEINNIEYKVANGLSCLVTNTKKVLDLKCIDKSITSCDFSELSEYTISSIDYHAFAGCTSLTSITIPESVTSIGGSAFYDCTSLTSITIPDSVTSIGNYAFYGCTGLTNITIPESVTSIGSYAFNNCTSLIIYCEAQSQPVGWDWDWNCSNCPVVWEYTGE